MIVLLTGMSRVEFCELSEDGTPRRGRREGEREKGR